MPEKGHRRIAIAPEFAYGCTSRFEPGVAIIADVMLHDLELGKRRRTQVDPLIVPDIINQAPAEAELMRSVGIADGSLARTHFGQMDISMDEVAEHIYNIGYLAEN